MIHIKTGAVILAAGSSQQMKEFRPLMCIGGQPMICCGSCIARCPGLAITVINLTHGENMATLDFPYEYLPLPEAGGKVTAVDRSGEAVCDAKVLSVSNTAPGETCVVRIEFPSSQADRVKSIRRIKEGC